MEGFTTAGDAEQHLRTAGSDFTIVLSFGGPTPIEIGVCSLACSRSQGAAGILTGSITRRPGIVTPYDITATILDLLDIPIPDEIVGNPLTIDRDPNAVAYIERLERRLLRDDDFAPGLAAVTVSLGVFSIGFGLGLTRLGFRGAGLRAAQGGVFILPAWVVALFVPSGSWAVRAAVVLAGALLGASLSLRNPVRFCARVGLGSAVLFAILMAVAPLNPGGEPGLSLWANPLESWRFFGLINVQAAIIASGVVVWGVIVGLAPVTLAVLAAAALVVTGAPAIGANFVGVLTFTFGASAAVVALHRRRASMKQVVVAGIFGVGAFGLALLTDAGSPVSHGGRAARTISNGGVSAAWDLIERRLRLNAELIGDFTGGWLWVAGLAVSLVALIVWGLNAEQGDFRGRVAVLGGSLMALSSLALEDSGFYSGAVLWFVAADAWLLLRLTSSAVGAVPPESDAPLAGVGSGTRPPRPGAARRPRSSPD